MVAFPAIHADTAAPDLDRTARRVAHTGVEPAAAGKALTPHWNALVIWPAAPVMNVCARHRPDMTHLPSPLHVYYEDDKEHGRLRRRHDAALRSTASAAADKRYSLGATSIEVAATGRRPGAEKMIPQIPYQF